MGELISAKGWMMQRIYSCLVKDVSVEFDRPTWLISLNRKSPPSVDENNFFTQTILFERFVQDEQALQFFLNRILSSREQVASSLSRLDREANLILPRIQCTENTLRALDLISIDLHAYLWKNRPVS